MRRHPRSTTGLPCPTYSTGAGAFYRPVRIWRQKATAGVPSRGAKQNAGEILCPTCKDESARQSQTIPGFKIVRELGRGGMGIVHLALNEGEKKPAA